MTTHEYKDFEIRIEPDYDFPWDDHHNPRNEDDLVGTISWGHGRYQLFGHNDIQETEAELSERVNLKDCIWLPVYMYDHGSQAFSTTSFHGRAAHAEWDSGQVGIIYARIEDVKSYFRWKHISDKRIKAIEARLALEVDDYNKFHNAVAHHVTVKAPENIHGWGDIEDDLTTTHPYDEDLALEYTKEEIDHILKQGKHTIERIDISKATHGLRQVDIYRWDGVRNARTYHILEDTPRYQWLIRYILNNTKYSTTEWLPDGPWFRATINETPPHGYTYA